MASALKIFLFSCLLVVSLFRTEAIASPKSSSIVLDAHTGQVIYSQDADEIRYPASLTKIMTLYLLFEKIERGDVHLTDKIVMTRRGAAQPPTKLGLRGGESISVENAILALVTRSANDVASAVGAFISGTEADFAEKMTAKAHQLGMEQTVYKNASGLPNHQHVTTARDQAVLALRIYRDFPDLYSYFSTEEFRWGKARIRNHNKLLHSYAGTTGIKTGYTIASGYNLTASVERDGKFLIAVVMGGKRAEIRDRQMTELLDLALPYASQKFAGTSNQ